MADEVFRTFTTDDAIVIREAADGSDGRTIEGYAVLFDRKSEVEPGVFEMIRKGALTPFRGKVHLRSKHLAMGGVEIGMVELEEDDKGLKIRARISNTVAGNDALELIRDKVLTDLSVGFYEKPGYVSVDSTNTRIVNRGDLFEVALTHQAAHVGAMVTAIREVGQEPTELEGHTMPDTELVEVRESLRTLTEAHEDVTRQLATMRSNQSPLVADQFAVARQFTSAGEWLKALVDPATRTEAMKVNGEIKTAIRAFNGTKMADTVTAIAPTAWIADAIRIVSDNSIAVDRFRRAPLPSTGNVMEYLTFGASTLQVQEQAAEGDVLAFGKLSLDSASTGLKTYGGYTSFSFQAIQRSPVNIVDMAYSLLTREAAKRRNAAVVAKLINGGAYSGVAVGNTAPATFDAWLSVLVAQKMAQQTNGLGLPVDSYLVSADVYTTLLGVKDSAGNRLLTPPGLVLGGLTGYAGTASLPTGTSGGLPAGFGGDLLGIPVYVEPLLSAATMLAVARDAAVVFGDDNPTRLGPDNDITTLTSEISVYFEMGAATQFASGIQKFTLS